MMRNCKIAGSRSQSVSNSTSASKMASWPRTSSLAQPPAGSPSLEKQQRIRQVLGVGPEYGPDAAPESLLPSKPEPN